MKKGLSPRGTVNPTLYNNYNIGIREKKVLTIKRKFAILGTVKKLTSGTVYNSSYVIHSRYNSDY